MSFYALKVAEITRETSDCVSIRFAVPAALADIFAFQPGQYLTLRHGPDERRAYSICSGLDDNELRIAIKLADPGGFSEFANTLLSAGDFLDVMPPEGRFGLLPNPAKNRNILALAAGSGITPILSIIKSVLSREPLSRVVFFYGSRATAGIIFRATLEDLKDRYISRFTVIHKLSRETQDVAVLNGHVDAAALTSLLPGLLTPADIDAAFLCGPTAMLDSLPIALAALGVPEDRIHTERFTSSTPPRPRAIVSPDAAPFATATIIHEGQSRDIPIAKGEAVLDAALRAGMDLPWSCRGGMCCTCRARLVAGEAEMIQNFSLEPWETAAGFVLTCQAQPRSAHLIVDYDAV